MKKPILFLVLLIGLSPVLFAQTTISQDQRMQWWREARFGMFIHWGLYAIPAGEWQGQSYPDIGEWIMQRAKIPVREYEKLAGQFNPTQFNAKEWVAVAKQAGMKYITITSKHHDGFAMFKSTASKYNIVDATLYRKDPIKELAEECHRQGLKMCFYYSQILDWHEPDGEGNNWDFTTPPNFQKYLDEKVKPQLTELLTQYGAIDLIWFDVAQSKEKSISREQAQSLKDLVRKLQPQCIISGRLCGGVETDYRSTGDNVIPSNFDNGDWEVPATLNHTWGFRKDDHDWKNPETLTRFLFDIAAKGGNYLLNVGPTAEGIIPPESVAILGRVGEWMKANSECIYGTTANPFRLEFDWGNITQKPGKLFLGFSHWPTTPFSLGGLKNPVKKIYCLADPAQTALPFEATYDSKNDHHNLKIILPTTAPDKVLPVVVVEIEGNADVEKEISQQSTGTLLLPGLSAQANKNGLPAALDFSGRDGGAFWTDGAIRLSWDFKIEQPGVYQVEIVTTETGLKNTIPPVPGQKPRSQWLGGHRVLVRVNGSELPCTITADRKEFYPPNPFWNKIYTSVGPVTFAAPGTYQLSLVPRSLCVEDSGIKPEELSQYLKPIIGFTFKEIVLHPLNP